MELRDLRYFVALAEQLHFGRAARELRIAQPSLSMQLRRLEEELRTTLLLRSSRRVELTDAGRLFYAEAKTVLAAAARAAHAAGRLGSRGTTRLRVACGYCMDTRRLARVVAGIARSRPAARVELETLAVPQQTAALREGRQDVGLLRPPVDDPYLASEPLLSEPLLVALPAAHRLARKTRLPLAALAEERFVLVSRRTVPVYHDLVVRGCREAGFAPLAEHEADHLPTLLELVAAGAGVALVPAFARQATPRRVALRELRAPAPVLHTSVAWRREDASPLVAEFVAALRKAFGAAR